MVGKLDKAMCGTRDAPAAWQVELEKTLIEVGFRPVVSTPCLYCHPSRGIRVAGHVDDLMCVGLRSGLVIFLAKLKGVYESTSTFLGPLAGEEQEGRFLNADLISKESAAKYRRTAAKLIFWRLTIH